MTRVGKLLCMVYTPLYAPLTKMRSRGNLFCTKWFFVVWLNGEAHTLHVSCSKFNSLLVLLAFLWTIAAIPLTSDSQTFWSDDSFGLLDHWPQLPISTTIPYMTGSLRGFHGSPGWPLRLPGKTWLTVWEPLSLTKAGYAEIGRW